MSESTERNTELNPMIGVVMTVFFLILFNVVWWFATPGQQVIHFWWPQVLVP